MWLYGIGVGTGASDWLDGTGAGTGASDGVMQCQRILNQDGSVTADCSGRGYTSLPAHWDPDVTSVDLSNNQLETLEAQALCALPGGLKELQLPSNRLQIVRNDTFRCLTSLDTLDLSDNLLHALELDAFRGLSQLQHLNLFATRLQYLAPDDHASLPAGVFAPLRSLLTLRIDLNQDHDDNVGDYTQGVFGDLVSLTTLTIDAFFDVRFESNFARLTSLHTLRVRTGGKAEKVYNDSFQAFVNSSLTTLDIHCHVMYLEACAFCNLRSLKVLIMEGSEWLKPQEVFSALYGLQGLHMEEITLDKTGKALSEFYSLDLPQFRYLLNICVRRFSVTQSVIMRVTRAFAILNTLFTQCLEHLDLSNNTLRGDRSIFFLLPHFERLESFVITNQNLFSLSTAACITDNDQQDCGNKNVPKSKQDNKYSSNSTLYIKLPSTMVTFNLSSAIRYFNGPPAILNFTSAGRLKVLDWSYGLLAHCMTTLVGLSSLETLELSGNYCTDISDDLLDQLPFLRHLGLAEAHLNSTYVRTRLQRLLARLNQLRTLDLSGNHEGQNTHIYP
jgi:Leucine-rich repeat (LRR) protein